MAEPAPYLSLGRRLRDLRKATGVSQEELALRLSISASYVSALENGKFQPTTNVLESYESVLGADYNELAELAGHLKRRTVAEWTPPADKAGILRLLANFSADTLIKLERMGRIAFLEGLPPKEKPADSGDDDAQPDNRHP